MRPTKLLVPLGVLLVALGLAAVGFGPAVRSRINEKAARYGASVSIERVSPIWLGVHLENVSVQLQEIPSLSLRLPDVRVSLDSSAATRVVHVQGGEIKVSGDPLAFKEQVQRWLARLPYSSSSASSGPRTEISVANLQAGWEHQGQLAQASGLALQREADGWQVSLETARLAQGEQQLSLEKGALVVGRSDQGARTFRWKAHRLSLDVHLPEETRPSAAPAPSVSASAAKPVAPVPSVPETTSGSRFSEQVPRWKQLAHEAAQALVLAAAEGSSIEVEEWKATVHRGKEVLHVGPSRLQVKIASRQVGVSLAPAQAAEGGAPLLVSAEIPVDGASGLALRVNGGPVTLAMLGVHEGDFGLLDVNKAAVEVGGELKLSPDGKRVEGDLNGVVRALSLEHRKLSTEPVKGLDLRFAWVGSAALDGSEIRVDRGEFGVGKVHAEFSGRFERQGEHHSLQGKFAVPLASCQSALEALPAGLAPILVGMKMNGTFAVKGGVSFDSKRANQTEVEFQLLQDCRATEVPAGVDVGRFRQAFRRQVYDGAGKRVEVETGPGTPGWVSMGGITRFMEAAVLMTEDGGFRRHRGFDQEAIRNSIRENLKAGKFLRGASTISMQTAKNLYLFRDKTVGRKLQEAFLTMYLEQALSKEQILELYLNIIEFGPMVYGIGPAAQYYFRTSAGELSLAQSLYLASILPNPKRQHFGPDGRLTPGFMGYLRRLMRGMAKRNLIREDELEDGLQDWVVFGEPPQMNRREKLPDGLEDTNEGAAPPDARLFLSFQAEGVEESAELEGASLLLDAAEDLDAVVEARVFEGGEAAADGASLGVISAIDEALDAGREEGPGAHEAGFEGADEGAAGEAPGAEGLGGLAEGEDLGVGGGVEVELASIEGGGDEGACGVEDEGTDGDVPAVGGEGSNGECLLHPR